MNKRTVFAVSGGTIVFVLALVLAFRLGGLPQWASAPAAEAAPLVVPDLIDSELPLQQVTNDRLILSYAAKFVCTAALPPGTFWYGLAAPIVNQATQVLIHNPHDFNITFYKKAVIAPLEDQPPVAPGKWNELKLGPDYAVRINCDDIAILLTGKTGATFAGTYGYGKTVEGFVVIGIGVQTLAGTNLKRYAPLDVTAEYERSSEVMKKDIHYQPWWTWWWWRANLPWQLGYPYERLVPIGDSTGNIDCRGLLYSALAQDVQRDMKDAQEKQATLDALEAGRQMGPTMHVSADSLGAETPTALVAMVGNCRKLDANTADIDYVLLSNKASTDPNPITAQPAQASLVRYPWHPGRWYDLALVTPQNLDVDLNTYFLQWQSNRWITAGETSTTVSAAMAYYFPWWCGWGYWYWWWNAGDCTDIGVGEGESLDVESVAPQRVFMTKWPPIP